jgi:hypothetical protein
MNFTHKIAEYVCNYHKDNYGLIITPEELMRDTPWHKIVGISWRADLFYKKPGWHNSLEEVADRQEGIIYCILQQDGSVDRYEFREGRFFDIGGMNESMYK